MITNMRLEWNCFWNLLRKMFLVVIGALLKNIFYDAYFKMVFENCLKISSSDNFVNNRRCTKMILTKIILEIECSNVVLLKLSSKLMRGQFYK